MLAAGAIGNAIVLDVELVDVVRSRPAQRHFDVDGGRGDDGPTFVSVGRAHPAPSARDANVCMTPSRSLSCSPIGRGEAQCLC